MSEKKALKYKNKLVLYYSSKIECEWCGENRLRINVLHPQDNMQTDAAAFEGIATLAWCENPDIHITLSFPRIIKWDGQFPFAEPHVYKDNGGHFRVRSGCLHYMRFLYRVMRFQKCFEHRFEVANDNKKEITRFSECYKKNLENGKFYITKPDTDKSGLKDVKILEENHLEKWFVMNSHKPAESNKVFPVLSSAIKTPIALYDQMPCSIFIGKKSEKTKIFSSGYFDLWGVNPKGELCIFELKKAGNTPLGIISELFFYSMIAQDMRLSTHDDRKSSVRGFDEFMKTKDVPLIKAYFLAPALHSSIENNLSEVLKQLNSAKNISNVEFGYIKFKQEEITGTNEEQFVKKLNKDWKNFDVK